MEVEEIAELLSADQKTFLNQMMSRINPSGSLSEEILVSQYSTARQFIHSCTLQN